MVDFGSLAISSPVGYVATDVRPNEFGGDGLPCAFDAWMAQSVDYTNLHLRHACGTDGCLGPLQTSTMISTLLKFKPVQASCEICRKSGPSGCSCASSWRSTPYKSIDEITSRSSSILLSGNGASIVAIGFKISLFGRESWSVTTLAFPPR